MNSPFDVCKTGHELYVEEVKKKTVYAINEKSLPWVNHNIREQELVKVIGIKYEVKPPRLCCLKVILLFFSGFLIRRVLKGNVLFNSWA